MLLAVRHSGAVACLAAAARVAVVPAYAAVCAHMAVVPAYSAMPSGLAVPAHSAISACVLPLVCTVGKDRSTDTYCERDYNVYGTDEDQRYHNFWRYCYFLSPWNLQGCLPDYG